jgi:hypothetical protein
MLGNIEQAKLLFEQDEITREDILHFLENKTARVKIESIEPLELEKYSNEDKTDNKEAQYHMNDCVIYMVQGNMMIGDNIKKITHKSIKINRSKSIVKTDNRTTNHNASLISNDENLNTNTDENLERLLKADLHDFLDGLCSSGGMERFTQQIVSFLNGKKLGKATSIKLKYGNPDITQQYIKNEVSYYTYKIWLTLKKKENSAKGSFLIFL